MKKIIAGPYGSVEVDMTPEEIAAKLADDSAPARPLPFQEQVRLAYQALPVALQLKYQQDILAATFQFERGNIALVGVNILLAEQRLAATGEEAVANIIAAAKIVLGEELMQAAAAALQGG
jgi:hypothetical protein